MQYLPISPLGELANCVGVLIKRFPDAFVSLTACKTENIYHVYGALQSQHISYFLAKSIIVCFLSLTLRGLNSINFNKLRSKQFENKVFLPFI